MNNFSPNMLKTFDECQQKYFLKYVERVSVPQPSYLFEKGKKIHALANYHLKGFDISKMEKTLNAKEKEAWQSLKASEYFNNEVVDTEYNLSCKVDKYWIGGRLDALMKEQSVIASESEAIQINPSPQPSPSRGEGAIQYPSTVQPFNLSTFYILDYKTGNIPQNAQDDYQTIVYLLCADKYLNKKGGYENLEFVYIGLKPLTPNPSLARGEGSDYATIKPQEKIVEITNELKKEYEEKIKQICKKIEFAINSKVFEKNKTKCDTCEYKKLCEEAVS